MEPTDLITAVNRLQNSVDKLSDRADTTEEMLKKIQSVSDDTRHNRIGLEVAAVGIVLDLLLTFFGVWLFVKVDSNTHQVQDVQARTSTQILCPLYTVFALSIKSNPAPANLTPDQIQVRQQAGVIITAGLKTLGCP